MHKCSVFGCKNEAHHKFPKDENVAKLWEAATGRKDFKAKKHSKICAAHFKTEDFIQVGRFSGLKNTNRILKKGVVPSIFQCTKTEDIKSKQRRERAKFREANGLVVSEQEAQPSSQMLDARTPSDSSGKEQDVLSRVMEQCRFCGEFSKDCVAVSSDMTYLAGNKTALALNDTSVQLDFNDRSLPKTVCRDCDAKLQEFCDFVKVVKVAQCTLINIAEEKAKYETGVEFKETTADFDESTADYKEIEIPVVKIEGSYDHKEGIIDPSAVVETVLVNKAHKRKSATDTAKPKKLKDKEKCDDDLVIAIKQEVIEKDTNEQSEVNDTETDVKPSELELARSALVFQIAGDGTIEYQGYRSDR